jgi:hypothetical protein
MNNNNNMELFFISDPGHGWLRVPMKLLEDWNIDIMFSPYSYRTKAFAFLEEDCDAEIFIKEAKSRNFEHVIHYTTIDDFISYLQLFGNYYRFNNNIRTA